MTEVERERVGSATGTGLYTARTRTTGGRENGVSRSSDGRLDVTMSIAGSTRIGTNPEQLLAAAWSASFESAIAFAARRRRLALSGDLTIDAEVTLNRVDDGNALSVRFVVGVPGTTRDVARTLIEEAERMCPYFRATRGNVAVAVELT